MRVVTSKQMREIEENAGQYDITFYRLMENAGSAAAAFIRRTIPVEGINCMIFCSKGNNGGDGLVVARRLFENGANVLIVMVDGQPKSGEAASMYSMVELMSLPILSFTEKYDDIVRYLDNTDVIVDAIFGTGFSGELDTMHRRACDLINEAIAAVFSLDLPTGVSCDAGRVDPGSVQADFTIVFDSLKPAHIQPACQPFFGQIQVVDIGIPEEARYGLSTMVMHADLEGVMASLPPRELESHKGSHGRLLNITGSLAYQGAPVLSTMAAQRCGVGYTVVAGVPAVCAGVTQRALEAIMLPLPVSASGGISAAGSIEKLLPALGKATAVLFGCGMGNTEDTAQLLELVLKNASCPVIVDADGINALAGNINILEGITCPVILTPHPGEMSRLTGLPVEDIQADRNKAALDFAAAHKVTVVLKGHETVTANADGLATVNTTGNPGLAKAGSGDVLAGMIGALAAQGVPPYRAAVCGVFLHGLAADRAAERLSQYAMLPSDILTDLCGIFLENGR
ncbi:NAD(P)H-hydrate dehydratase [Oscillospiraceae bacterium MB08-C2-2]|nr:NAD(P)H-hydrate dehydratase [Oscillospiraceae bacterium MB08-C2-2]